MSETSDEKKTVGRRFFETVAPIGSVYVLIPEAGANRQKQNSCTAAGKPLQDAMIPDSWSHVHHHLGLRRIFFDETGYRKLHLWVAVHFLIEKTHQNREIMATETRTRHWVTEPHQEIEVTLGPGFAGVQPKTVAEVLIDTINKHGDRRALCLKRPVNVC